MSTAVVSRGSRGGVLVVLGQGATAVVQIIGTVALSRLLDPSAFGLVAMVAVFVALGDLLRDFGMPTAALQAETLTQRQASNIFWVNSLLAATAAGSLVASTPMLIGLYDETRLRAIVPWMAAAILLNGIQAQLQIQLARAMRYGALAATAVAAQLCGVVAAVAAASAGLGHWALVVQIITTAATQLAGRALACRWLPSLPQRGHQTLDLVRIGVDHGLGQFLRFGANNADSVLIGAWWGPTPLGYYNRAFQVYSMPRNALLDPLTQVVVPTIREAARESAERARGLLLRVQFGLSAMTCFVYLNLACTAPWLVPLVLGPQWDRSVPILQLLAIAGCMQSFGSITYWAFILGQKSRELLVLQVLTKPLSVALLVAAAPFGVQWIAGAYAAGFILSWPVNLFWQSRHTSLGSREFLNGGLWTLAATAVSFLLTTAILNHLFSTDPLISLIVGSVIASTSFVALLSCTPGALTHMRSLAKVLLDIRGAQR